MGKDALETGPEKVKTWYRCILRQDLTVDSARPRKLAPPPALVKALDAGKIKFEFPKP
jgi:hypothetical protein